MLINQVLIECLNLMQLLPWLCLSDWRRRIINRQISMISKQVGFSIVELVH